VRQRAQAEDVLGQTTPLKMKGNKASISDVCSWRYYRRDPIACTITTRHLLLETLLRGPDTSHSPRVLCTCIPDLRYYCNTLPRYATCSNRSTTASIFILLTQSENISHIHTINDETHVAQHTNTHARKSTRLRTKKQESRKHTYHNIHSRKRIMRHFDIVVGTAWGCGGANVCRGDLASFVAFDDFEGW